MKYFTTLILLFLFAQLSYAQLTQKYHIEIVENFVNSIKNNDIEALDSIISYPYKRPYPIPPIQNKKELKERYKELFDDSLRSVIVNSNITEDWSDVGWRGIMLNHGIIWLDYNGRLKAVNYTSKKEKEKEEKWIEHERNLLHADLKDFKKPIHTIETEKFIVRIDLLQNDAYRYASWSKNAKLSDKPDLVLKNGKWRPDGNGGNHYYIFENGEYSYIVYVNVLSEEDETFYTLSVKKQDKTLLSQDGHLKNLREE